MARGRKHVAKQDLPPDFLITGGGLKCWGSHQNGQLGIGGRNYGLPGDVLTIAPLFFNGFEIDP